MRKYLLLLLALCLAACAPKAPRYANRAAAIAAQIHDPASQYVVVVCHRGDWRNFPENSIPAIESIIRMGADMMELDLKLTADSVLVLSHDGDVRRCTNFDWVFRDQPGKSARIQDLTLAEIKSLSLKRAHDVTIDTLRMPTLREALAVCKDRICVNVDQGFGYYDQVMEVARELGVVDQLLIKSGHQPETVREKMGRYPEQMMYMPVVGLNNASGQLLLQTFLEEDPAPLAFELCWNSQNGVFEKACREVLDKGSKVWVNTIWASLCGGDGHDDDAAFIAGDPALVYRPLLEKGVSMIQTDRPEFLIGYLAREGRHTLPQ